MDGRVGLVARGVSEVGVESLYTWCELGACSTNAIRPA